MDVIIDEKRDDVYPRERGARVDIETSQGAYSAEVTIPKGEPENPASDDELKEKFFNNAGKILPVEKATDLLEMIFHIETASARELMNLLS